MEAADGLMLATFTQSAAALDWALACQGAMLVMDWPAELLEHELGQVGAWPGLRVGCCALWLLFWLLRLLLRLLWLLLGCCGWLCGGGCCGHPGCEWMAEEHTGRQWFRQSSRFQRPNKAQAVYS